MSARDEQTPPPEHTEKPVAEPGGAKIGERLTGEHDPKDPDGLLTLDGQQGDPDPDWTAGAGS